MAQANLKYLVEDAELRVQRTRRYLDHQREAVSSLERGGRDATIALRLLTISEKAFEIHVADRVRLTQRAGGAVARSHDI
jgi:ferredoxin-fold anticodon binding domain-containing protein